MNPAIGIRIEDKDFSERRAALTPQQVKKLISNSKIKVLVEPSPYRIFKNQEYRQAGAILTHNLEKCNIIFGVKEIPLTKFIPGKAYCFFSHTIKGQSYNMLMLKQTLNLRNTILDYEKVTDDSGRRLIFFGKFAGYAGMIDSLWALGKRLSWEGIANPFKKIKQAVEYDNLRVAKEEISEIGKFIKTKGLLEEVCPFICGFTGYGQVSQGAQEIFDLLPVEEIPVSKLNVLNRNGKQLNKKVYKVVFREADLMKPRDASGSFSLEEYLSSPEKYESRFTDYLPFLTMLINGIYWEPKYPKLVTRSFLKAAKLSKLKIIGDITCDIEGSVECTLKSTNSENPVYVYNPVSQTINDGYEGDGIVILAVDKLPAELPRESSESFGDALLPFVPALAKTDFSRELSNLNLPEPFKPAVITHNGLLAPDFRYLKKFLK